MLPAVEVRLLLVGQRVELDALRANRETPLEHASGLGLWLTSWIVDFADGDVTYAVDDGTTVTLELPVAD